MAKLDTYQVAVFIETNVRILECAWAALTDFQQARGCSRDEAVRLLLSEHLTAQEACEPDDRLTHISTVLRHPLPPVDRTAPRLGRPLRLRIPADLAARAHALSMRLPGQSERRGHRDYQPRPLTDAVITAIARQCPFSDEVLDGIRPLIRHRAAAGLWGLVVAATITQAEDEVYESDRNVADKPYEARSAADYRLQLVAEALRADVSWHGRWRFQIVAHLAGKLLRGPKAEANEQMLYDQTRVWELLRSDLELTVGYDHELFEGLAGTHHDLEGRGGAAVWRAERRVSLQDFEDWIMGKVERFPCVVTPPGWRLDLPRTWTATVGSAAELWSGDNRVLTFTAQERTIAWPLRPAAETGRLEPVPGMEAVIRAARDLPSGKRSAFAECVLVRFDTWSDEFDAGDDDDYDARYDKLQELLGSIQVPPHKAREFGFISWEQERRLRAEARDATVARMNAIIEGLPDDEDKTLLREAMPDTRTFKTYAKRMDIAFAPVRAWWIWPVRSLADEVERGTSPAALEWLAARVRDACARGLERSMELAWHAAFERYRPPVTGYVTSTVNSCRSP